MNNYFESYLESKITADQLIDKLECNLNENIIQDFKSFLKKGKEITEKTFDKLSKWILKELEVEVYIFDKLIEKLKKVSGKIIELFLTIFKRIKQFKDKNPKLFKLIVIIFLIICIILISAVVAYSQTQGQPVNIEQFGIDSDMLNAMIGFADTYGLDPKITAALIDLKDGTIDLDYNNPELSKTYIESIRKVMIDEKDSDPYFWQKFVNWMEVGEKYVDVMIETISKEGPGNKDTSQTFNFLSKSR